MGKPSTQTSTQQSGPPAAVLANYENVYNQAANVASQPAPQYSGSLLAGFQPQQVAGFNNVNTAANSYQPFLNAASQYANNATSMLSPGNAQSTVGNYIDPALQTYINASGNYMNASLGQAANALNYTNTGIGQAQSALGQYTNPAVAQAYNSIGQYTNPALAAGQASLGQYTNPAEALARGSLGQYTNTAIGQGNSAASNLNAQNFGNTVNSYYSPYARSVIAPTEAQFNQQNAVQQSQLAGNAAAQGAYGGDRQAVAAAQLAGQQQMAEAPVIAGLETQGYNQAAQNAFQGAGLGMQAAGLTMQGGTQAQNVAQLGLQGGQQAQNVANMGFTAGNQAQAAAALGLQGGNQALQAAGMTMAGAQPALQEAGLTMQGANQVLAEGQLNQAGYNAGMSAAQADAWLNSQGSFAMGNLGNEAESLGLTGANAQIGAGGMQQQLAQQELNIPYQQFQAAQAYPYQMTNFLEGAATGLGGLSGQQGSTTQPGPSGLSQAAGLGLSGLGMAGLLGWAPFAARGGRIDDDKMRAVKSLRRDIVWRPPHRADGGHVPHRQMGGAGAASGPINPGMPMAGMGAPMGSPMASNLYGQYAQLPTEKLQELAARMPGNTMLQHAIQMRRMQPQADSGQQEQATPGLGQQMQSAPGGFSNGGELRRPDGGLIPDMDNFAAAEDPTAGPGGISGMGPMDLTPMPVPPMPPHGMMAGHQRSAGSPADRSSDQFNLQELNRLHGVSGAPPLQQQGLGPQEDGGQGYVDDGTWDQPTGGGGGGHTQSHNSNFMATPSGMLLAAGLGILGGHSPYASANIGQGALQGLQFGQQAMEHQENARMRELQIQELADYRKQGLQDREAQMAQSGQNSATQHAIEMAKLAQSGQLTTSQQDIERQKLASQQDIEKQRLEQGKYTWSSGMGPDPNDPSKQVSGMYRLPMTGQGQPQFIANQTLSAKTQDNSALLIPPDVVQMKAQQAMAGDTSALTGLGYGKAATQARIAVQTEIAKQLKTQGLTGSDLASKTAEFMGEKAGSRTAGTREANVGMAVNEAQNFMPLALQASANVDRTQYPTLNSIIQSYEKGTGDENIVRLAVATNSLTNAYSRAITPSGIPTEGNQQRAHELLDKAWSQGQYSTAVDQLWKEMQAAKASPIQVRQEQAARISGRDPNAGAATPALTVTPQVANIPHITDPAEALKLPKGSQFMDPNGILRTVP